MSVQYKGFEHFEGTDNAGVAATVPAGTNFAVACFGVGDTGADITVCTLNGVGGVNETEADVNSTRQEQWYWPTPTSGNLIWNRAMECVITYWGLVDLTDPIVDSASFQNGTNDAISLLVHTEAGGAGIWSLGAQGGGSAPGQGASGMTIPYSDTSDAITAPSGVSGCGYVLPTVGGTRSAGWGTPGTDREWAIGAIALRPGITGGDPMWFFSKVWDKWQKRVSGLLVPKGFDRLWVPDGVQI